MSMKGLIEAALFASGRALSLKELAELCESGSMGPVRKAAEELRQEYQGRKAGIEIAVLGESYMVRVAEDYEEKVLPLVPETDMPQPVLKTLALIAYEGPIKQTEVVRIRGSHCYKYIKFLREREFIDSQKEGRTRILKVTPKFREYFKIEDLPPLQSSQHGQDQPKTK